ncbi:hypothetical protein [Paenibacillus lutimineralis]|uniref:Uncharacterized protein n=1 Tax=Paenibacillus lutimineralis TaxID=2707005 RepID=A0A3Q9IEY2_9BACL|nr:hypothetical protein [Paenibacillus lutimineralis]AZS17586.1 hypothetical protein EI981_26250 [Paenibacillus lutimineralis]
MKVSINQEQEQFIDNTIEKLDGWWKQATEAIYQQRQLIQYVELDGNLYYDGYEQYIIENVNRIKEINICTLSKWESIQDTERSIVEYLDRFIPAGQDASIQFFGEIKAEQHNIFAQFIDGLSWIVSALEFNRILYKEVGISQPEYLTTMDSLDEIISGIYENVQRDDYIAIGDIIQYEIVPLMQEIQKKMKKSELS